MRRPLVLAGLAFALGAATYLPSLGHGFVWDDRTLIAENRYIRDARETGRNLTSDFFRRSADPARIGHWRPVVTATYMADWRLGGGSPRAFHLTNVVLHGAAAALIVALALALGLPEGAALAAAALFATHPVHVEAVAWISGRTDLLCGVLVLAALTLEARGARWPAALATLLAIGAKEMAVVVPFAVALRAWLLPRSGDRAWRAAWPHLAAVGLYAFVRLALLGVIPRPPEAAAAGRAALFWTWWSALVEYVRVLAWPLDLSIVPRVALETSPFAPRVLLGLTLAGATAATAWRLRTRVPVASWALMAFLASLAPLTSFVVPVRAISTVPFPWAERFLLVPSIFLAVAAAAAIAALPPRARRAGWTLAAVVATAWTARTVARERVWASQRTLFAAAVAEAPQDSPAHANLAAALLDAGDLTGAEDHLRRALAIAPREPIALYLLGNVQRQRGALDAAESSYRAALSLRPSYPQALVNLGLVLAARGDLDGAAAQFRAADDMTGGSPEAKVNLAIVMRMTGRPAEAIALYRDALALDPAFVPAREGLAALTP